MVRYAAVRGRAQNMIVGGGWIISSSSVVVTFLAFLGFDFRLWWCGGGVSEGEMRRRRTMDSGGLHRR